MSAEALRAALVRIAVMAQAEPARLDIGGVAQAALATTASDVPPPPGLDDALAVLAAITDRATEATP